MRAVRYSIIVGFLILIAGLVKGSRDYAFKASGIDHPVLGMHHPGPQFSKKARHFIPVLAQSPSSDQGKHRERRHVKSLISQAIIADCPVGVVPVFTYCHRHYSLFLPGGCSRQFTGNFSLRGPPVC